MTLLDVLGGLVAATGILAGLLGREQDGRGRRVSSSLLSVATLLQAPVPQAPVRQAGRTGRAPAELPAAIAARPAGRSLALLTAAGVHAVRACPDPAELVDDPWAATLLHHDRCALVRPPWTFAP